jgi:hypothetical protein
MIEPQLEITVQNINHQEIVAGIVDEKVIRLSFLSAELKTAHS